MPINGLQIFDQNKTNMLTDAEYTASQQRLGGVQAGIASSMLENKMAYQVSLVAYAIGQLMVQNGFDATDALATTTFVSNLSNSVLQKIIDKATTAEAQSATSTVKYMTPALVKSYFDYVAATLSEAKAGTVTTKWISPYGVSQYFTAQRATLLEASFGVDTAHWMNPANTKASVQKFGTLVKNQDGQRGSLYTSDIIPFTDIFDTGFPSRTDTTFYKYFYSRFENSKYIVFGTISAVTTNAVLIRYNKSTGEFRTFDTGLKARDSNVKSVTIEQDPNNTEQAWVAILSATGSNMSLMLYNFSSSSSVYRIDDVINMNLEHVRATNSFLVMEIRNSGNSLDIYYLDANRNAQKISIPGVLQSQYNSFAIDVSKGNLAIMTANSAIAPRLFIVNLSAKTYKNVNATTLSSSLGECVFSEDGTKVLAVYTVYGQNFQYCYCSFNVSGTSGSFSSVKTSTFQIQPVSPVTQTRKNGTVGILIAANNGQGFLLIGISGVSREITFNWSDMGYISLGKEIIFSVRPGYSESFDLSNLEKIKVEVPQDIATSNGLLGYVSKDDSIMIRADTLRQNYYVFKSFDRKVAAFVPDQEV